MKQVDLSPEVRKVIYGSDIRIGEYVEVNKQLGIRAEGVERLEVSSEPEA